MDRLIEGAATILLKVIPDKILDAVQRRRESDLDRVRADRAAVEVREARRREP